MRKLASVALAAVTSLLAACSQNPYPMPELLSGQRTMATAGEWPDMADGLAAEVLARATDGSGAVVRPVYVEPRDPFMPFADAYHDQLVSRLSQAGVPVVAVPGDALVVRYRVRPIVHEYLDPSAFPGVFTGLGALAGAGPAIADKAGVATAAVSLGGIADIISLFSAKDQAEVVVTNQIVDDGVVLWSRSESWYVPEGDIGNFVAWTPAPAIRLAATPVPLPVQALPVVGPGEWESERAERIYRRSLRK